MCATELHSHNNITNMQKKKIIIQMGIIIITIAAAAVILNYIQSMEILKRKLQIISI